MASPGIWADFESLRHNVKLNTVDRLKQVLTGFNDECSSNLTKSGKKQELIDRITREMDTWRRTNNTERWTKGKAILTQVRVTGQYSPSRGNEVPYQNTSTSHTSYAASTSGYVPGAQATPNNIPRYDPYARIPHAPTPTIANAVPQLPTPSIRFKPSPFFRVERAISSVMECPESTGAMDRRQQSLNFTVPSDVALKLNTASPRYTLRLYCTSSSYYSPAGAFRSTTTPCLIEFPPTCEVRINSIPLTANLKGMKKKPGTAPPPDLGKSVRTSTGTSNRVEMVYVNNQQPVQAKKFYLVVMLVEVTTVEELIDRLKKGKSRSSQEIRAKMAQAASADDEIVAGHQKMSLKCPLSYMRITTPCRSASCVHSQCFDAFSWYSVMEQTTTWLCPVCEKVLNVDDLIVDGYFNEILDQTPEDVEDVIVEADGQWHSSDNKCGSADWKVNHPTPKSSTPLKMEPPAEERPRSPVKLASNGAQDKKSLPNNAEIVILDSDDEDEGRVKRELSPSNEPHGLSRGNASFSNRSKASQPPRSQTTAQDEVIDLTLESDDDGPPTTKKRKTTDSDFHSPTETIWKKSRYDGLSSSPASSSGGNGAYVNGSRPTRPVSGTPSSSSSAPIPHYVAPSYSTNAQGYQLAYPMPIPPASRTNGTHHGHYDASSGNPYLPRAHGTSPPSDSW